MLELEKEEQRIEEYQERNIKSQKAKSQLYQTIMEYNAILFEISNVSSAFFDLTEEDVRDYICYLDAKAEEGQLKYSTIVKKIKILSAFVKDTARRYPEEEEKWVDYFDRYRPKYQNGMKKPEPLNLKEIEIFWNSLENDTDRFLFLLMYKLAMKTSEISNLKPSDFLVYDNHYFVKRYHQKKKENEYAEISNDTYGLLENIPQSTDHFLTPVKKQPITEHYISKRLRYYKEKTGIEKRITGMVLRKSGAALLYSCGQSEEELENFLNIHKIWVKEYEHIVTENKNIKMKDIIFFGTESDRYEK